MGYILKFVYEINLVDLNELMGVVFIAYQGLGSDVIQKPIESVYQRASLYYQENCGHFELPNE